MQESIIKKAAGEINRFGFRRFTMDDIAGGLGISKKTLYKHFPSKGELIAAVLKKNLEREQKNALAVIETNEHWFDRLNNVMLNYCENRMPAHHIEEIRLYFPEEKKQIENIESFYREQFRHLMEEGINRGEIQPGLELEIVLQIIQELLNFSVCQSGSSKEGMEANRFLEEIKKVIFFGLIVRDW